ncbi:MAG: universal stress protein [Humidesulfovibrio sp.]|uniref:universal stress protein n=1 Tax=Humidesulfovibrio sp. TaxID=2910988 RepID=UPI0027FC3A1F|nr:universal stress protein [Humidesulfovibrio sp.]MDQ7836866.1 universal stress protein [Humidesulfovibrio sp.]
MFKHLLAPLDGSITAECTLPHLVALARLYQARVTLVRVLDFPETGLDKQPTDPLQWQLYKAEAKAYLDDVAERLRTEADLETESVLLEGEAAQSICDFAHSNDVAIIIISSHGQSGLSRWNVSSVAHKIVQRAHRSVMIVRAYNAGEQALTGLRYARLLVPLDGSQRAEGVLSTADTIARGHEAQLLLAYVVVKPEMPHQFPLTADDKELIEHFVVRICEAATQYMELLRDRLMYPFELRLLTSQNIALALHGLAEEAEVDMILLGAHGSSGKPKWPYGSVTTSFIEYGSVPLLVVQDLDPEEVEPTQAEKAAEEKKGH